MKLLGYTCTNEAKMSRVIDGDGRKFNGVGKDATDELKLATYDKFGGEILKGKDIVKMGSFYDFKNKEPRKEKKVKLVFRFGTEVEYVDEGKAVPTEIKIKKKIVEKKKEDKKKKK